jgi:hypothetical protein
MDINTNTEVKNVATFENCYVKVIWNDEICGCVSGRNLKESGLGRHKLIWEDNIKVDIKKVV